MLSKGLERFMIARRERNRRDLSGVRLERDAELDRYKAYGDLADVKEAVQAATLWNYIYHPAEYGPMLPVSRSWDFVGGAANSDWSYVIFDWDNIFASFMSSLDPRSKAIAYSNFIQVIRSKTAAGFVPNYSAGGSKSVDRTEPPVGAKVLLEMYNKYKDAWLVLLLFEDLLEWNTWFLTARALGPLGLVSLGSDTYDGYVDWSSGAMQGARYESGLDNSPMYDGEDSLFVKNVSHEGAKLIGQMTLYDVGMASMFVQEAEALAALAPIAGKPELAAELRERAAAQRALIAKYLWDDSPHGQIFANRFWNGTFYRRITPTSFYALMAGAATDEDTVSRAIDLAGALGKTPVRVRECPGFVVNRVLVRAMAEAYRAAAGAPVDRRAADQAVAEGGPAPMGPFALGDLVGLDVLESIRADLEAAYGDRFDDAGTLAPLVAQGRLGRKTGGGLVPDGDGSPTGTEPVVAAIYYAAAMDEARRLADEGVASPGDIDLAMRLGAGWEQGPLAAG